MPFVQRAIMRILPLNKKTMVTIYLNSKDEVLSIESFEQNMIQICEEHKKEKRALAFAFLIYDFTNANLRKVLNDEEYWMALNQISGENLTVFSLNYKPKREDLLGGEKSYYGFQYLTSIQTTRNLTTESNKIADKYFEGTNITFPSLLFFQVNENLITDSLLIKLKEKNIEDSFNEIKDYIKAAVDSLGKVEEENKGNFKEMFDLITDNVQSKYTKNEIIRVIRNAGTVGALLSAFKKLLF